MFALTVINDYILEKKLNITRILIVVDIVGHRRKSIRAQKRSLKDNEGLKRSRKVRDGHGRSWNEEGHRIEEFDLGVGGFVPAL